MVDENLIATLEATLNQTRIAQNGLMARLREAEREVDILKQEIASLEVSAQKTEQTIDRMIVSAKGGSSSYSPEIRRQSTIEMEVGDSQTISTPQARPISAVPSQGGSVAYFDRQHRSIPSISNNVEAISNRFSDRTITQACTLLLREANGPLHVNELYNLLVRGGMKFKGNNPTISIAVSLNRNRRFRKVGPGTFDLMFREAAQTGS